MNNHAEGLGYKPALIGLITSVGVESITEYGNLLNTIITSLVQLSIAYLTIKNLYNEHKKNKSPFIHKQTPDKGNNVSRQKPNETKSSVND